MNTLLSHTTHIARKDHCDCAGEWICNQLDDIRWSIEMTFSEWRSIAKLKANKWMIKKGQKYDRYNQIYDGDFGVFKCLPAIHSICLKYELYSDD